MPTLQIHNAKELERNAGFLGKKYCTFSSWMNEGKTFWEFANIIYRGIRLFLFKLRPHFETELSFSVHCCYTGQWTTPKVDSRPVRKCILEYNLQNNQYKKINKIKMLSNYFKNALYPQDMITKQKYKLLKQCRNCISSHLHWWTDNNDLNLAQNRFSPF